MLSNHQTNIHSPVLLAEVLKYLAPEQGETYLDATAGYGGHASKVLEVTGQMVGSVLVDRDPNAIKQLQERFSKQGPVILHEDFAGAAQRLTDEDKRFDIILADLGVSSPHLDNASRGFSFQQDGPLDMRMDTSVGVTAADLVNGLGEAQLVEILSAYGEEPRSKRVAHAIIAHRPVETTHELASIVAHVYGGRGKYKTHPATKTFQALRIAVNDELTQLKLALPLWHQMLNPGGRLAIISFHSLEDRIVKQYFSEHGGDRYDATLQILTKKPVTSSDNELVSNPRARSAKLRVAVKK